MPLDYRKVIYLVTPVVAAQIADDSITNAKIYSAAAIVKTKLAALGIVDADVAVGAAIAKAKLAALDIVDADVNASAAIVKTKISTVGTWPTADIPDISATYSVKAGNTSLVTVGTIATGVWSGTPLVEAKVPTTYVSEITFSGGIRVGDLKFKNGWTLTEDGSDMVLVKGKRKVRLT